jgi:hypothetical protein
MLAFLASVILGKDLFHAAQIYTAAAGGTHRLKIAFQW